MTVWLPWREAAARALFGPDGFYRGPSGGHFRTSPRASSLFAEAVLALLTEVDDALGRPERLDFVDLGAGQGELVGALVAHARRSAPDLAARLAPVAVDVAPPPARGLPPDVRWTDRAPTGVVGLIVANELLDTVPIDVVAGWGAPAGEGGGGPHVVLVDPDTGRERPGPAPDPAQAAWLAAWWPTGRDDAWQDDAWPPDACRAEVGLERDAAWADVVRSLARGLAVAVDYGHLRAARPRAGTLAAFRRGHAVRPVPDGTRDITWHVAFDACAAAGRANGADDEALLTQRVALRALGLSGRRPDLGLARTDPSAYLRALTTAGEAAELTDPDGLGRFYWLLQTIGISLPPFLRRDTERSGASKRSSGV